MTKELIDVQLNTMINDILKDMGVNPAHLGYNRLKIAITLSFKDRSYLRAIIKRLYPDVSKTEGMGCSVQNIERTIRHAVERAFENMAPEVKRFYFGNTIDIKTGKVTSSTFIATIVNYIDGVIAQGKNGETAETIPNF